MQLPAPISTPVIATPGPAMTWEAICAAYPDQWVGLIDVVMNSDVPRDLRSARVVSFGTSPGDVLRALDPHRDHNSRVRHLFTGRLRSR